MVTFAGEFLRQPEVLGNLRMCSGVERANLPASDYSASPTYSRRTSRANDATYPCLHWGFAMDTCTRFPEVSLRRAVRRLSQSKR